MTARTAAKALREKAGGRDAERDPRELDLGARAGEAALHRLGGDEEGARDLVVGQTPESAQGQRHLGLGRERRVTAGEEQLQALVADLIGAEIVHVILHGLLAFQQARLGRQGALAADPIDRPVARGGDQPGHRVLRRALAGPALGGDGKRLLGGVLGELEVAEVADQGRQDAAPVPPEDAVEHGGGNQPPTSGRTSTEPPSRAAGTRAAMSIAASRLSSSNT